MGCSVALNCEVPRRRRSRQIRRGLARRPYREALASSSSEGRQQRVLDPPELRVYGQGSLECLPGFSGIVLIHECYSQPRKGLVMSPGRLERICNHLGGEQRVCPVQCPNRPLLVAPQHLRQAIFRYRVYQDHTRIIWCKLPGHRHCPLNFGPVDRAEIGFAVSFCAYAAPSINHPSAKAASCCVAFCR